LAWLRKEDARLVAGRGYFVGDIVLPGQVHCAFVRSAYPHANYSFGAGFKAAAMRSPGVVAVITAAEIGSLAYPSVNPLIANARLPTQKLLDGVARFVGEPVALVVAATDAQARHAADLVEINWQPIDAIDPSFAQAVYDWQFESSDDNKANGLLNQPPSSHSISIHHQQCRVSAAPLEPRAAVAAWQDNKLQLWIPTQTTSRARIDLAKILALPLEDIRVVAPDVGGAFGARASIYIEDILVAATARHLKIAVKWIGTRSEEFVSAMQGRGGDLKLAMQTDSAGQILQIEADLKFDLGAWCPFSAFATGRNAARILPGPYRVAKTKVSAQGFMSHTAPMNIYRGAGRPEAALLMERAIEAVARQLKMDPMQLRRQNIVAKQDFPITLPSGAKPDSADLLQCLERAESLFGYQTARAMQAQQMASNKLATGGNKATTELIGIGAALYIEPCGEGWESARLTLDEQGRYILHSGSSAQGQGRETAYTQIVISSMRSFGIEVAPELVTVLHSDTAICPEGIGALASRGTAIGGSAVVAACEQLHSQMQLQIKANTSVEGDGVARQPITVEVKYHADGEAWASGCVISQVRINVQTGELSIDKLVWVDDAGQVINPALVKGQMMGGLAQGLGQALMERLSYDRWGQLVTGSFMDYAMPRASDIPEVLLESICTPSPMNKLGAKGVGEAGCIGVPAALLNAVLDALAPLGIETIDFPLSSAHIWSAIHETSL
jgi:aerobic carbon-monoxide dehydrogenase large subunit